MTAPQATNTARPTSSPFLAKLHQQDWERNHKDVFANIVTLLTQAHIVLLQEWGDPVGGFPDDKRASALQP